MQETGVIIVYLLFNALLVLTEMALWVSCIQLTRPPVRNLSGAQHSKLTLTGSLLELRSGHRCVPCQSLKSLNVSQDIQAVQNPCSVSGS